MRLCLYGAGNTGKQFVRSNMDRYVRQYTDIFFVDSNSELININICGYKVNNIDSIDGNTEIIITSLWWHEIYLDCCLRGFNVVGIYNAKTCEIYTYKEMCRLEKCTFKNHMYIRYLDEKREKIDLGIDNFFKTNMLFENISEVAIMLSNLCNYAYIHKKCPANCIEKKEILSSKIVFSILDELSLIDFDGTICFHIYNEPLIDPRLFWFIEYIKNHLILAKVEVYSNGYYLNEQMIKELVNIGVDILQVTGYGESEYNRLIDLDVNIAYCVLWGNLDERLAMYADRDNSISSCACKTYFTQVSIYSNGDIGTCCLDYNHPYNLANLYTISLKEALNSERIVNMQKELLTGNRMIFPICKNCSWKR